MHREVYTAGDELNQPCSARAHARAVGGFVEGPGVSEDLLFFYEHMARGGTFSKVDEVHCPLARVAAICWSHPSFAGHLGVPPHSILRFIRPVKRTAYASACNSFECRCRCPPPRYLSHLSLQVRADAFQSIIIPQHGWERFSIWGCGRDGKRFFNLLSRENKQKVRARSSSAPRKTFPAVSISECALTMQVLMFVDVAEDKITRGAYNHGITGLKPTPVLHFSKLQLPVVRLCAVGTPLALSSPRSSSQVTLRF
jgi:hypothetical protein